MSMMFFDRVLPSQWLSTSFLMYGLNQIDTLLLLLIVSLFEYNDEHYKDNKNTTKLIIFLV